jgi:virulence-associated protein VagC
MKTTAKLIIKGRSQAVRLSKEFRFKGAEVKIRKDDRKVILEPSETSDWPAVFWDIFTPDPEFEIPKALSTKAKEFDRLFGSFRQTSPVHCQLNQGACIQ